MIMTATEILSGAGLKRTRQREAVIAALSGADKPLTAEEIYDRSGDMALSTIYRTIERLREKGIITSTTIPGSDGVFYELTENGHKHYAICLSCRRMKYIDVCPLHETRLDDFTVTSHKLELYGYCGDCREKTGQQ